MQYVHRRVKALLSYFATTGVLIKLVFHVSPFFFIGLLVLTLLNGLSPLATLLVSSQLIDVIANTLRAPSPVETAPGAFIPLLVLLGGIGLLDQLVGGYHAHDYCITRAEASAIGLRVREASQQEEDLLWAILQRCYDYFDAPPRTAESAHLLETVDGIIASTEFTARHVMPMIRSTPAGPGHAVGGEGLPGVPFTRLTSHWQIM